MSPDLQLLFVAVALILAPLVVGSKIRALYLKWKDRDVSSLKKKFSILDNKNHVIRIAAITKTEEKKVRIHIETDLGEQGIVAFSLDMTSMAAIELADSIRVSARIVANLELIEEGL